MPFAAVANAVGAESFEYKIGCVQVKAFGQIDWGYGQIAKAEGAFATFAVEVCVQVRHPRVQVLAAAAVGLAEGIFHLPRTVIDGVDKVMLEEECERAEDRRLIDRAQTCLEIRERECTGGGLQRAQYEYPVGCRADVTSFEPYFV